MKVVFLESAKQDLIDLRRYLVRFKPEGAWLAVKKQIQEKVAYIAEFPASGTRPDELAGFADGFRHRQHLTHQQRIIYRVAPATDTDTVYIHIICGQVQDFEEFLSRRLTRPW
ncbi:type II toxin-antitoxin system RelE/ParE family toxin [Cupriavidus basilensis]|uniref:type II toxin-antitoxin system RelE/ParE family toxin n=1 Tax=Cupriavidus basilensis TaxID=68895 RepID=UPI00157B6B6D|nr:type II toxin-antitoxin system RelE/ParE family toxin [Cupriavidus basilensis]NUA26757.1 type II toxin-antitoxin system RelE/ParE family toxin [Cupriavidus basilensis]